MCFGNRTYGRLDLAAPEAHACVLLAHGTKRLQTRHDMEPCKRTYQVPVTQWDAGHCAYGPTSCDGSRPASECAGCNTPSPSLHPP